MNRATLDPSRAVANGLIGLQVVRTKTILLVDDDAAIRKMLIGVLAAENYVVLPAANGVEAIWLATAINPDLVVLDLNMPLKGGWETLEWLTTHKPRLPVVVITGQSGQLDRVAGAGIDEFMEKPLDLPLLMKRIRDLLARPDGERPTKLADRSAATRHPIRSDGIEL